jgi:hypothetical protein
MFEKIFYSTQSMGVGKRQWFWWLPDLDLRPEALLNNKKATIAA